VAGHPARHRVNCVADLDSTLLEQVSASCQLRFNRVFLRTLIARLQSAERATGSRSA